MQLIRPWLLVHLCLLGVPPLAAQTPTTYKNSEYGFQIQIPKDFNPVPLKPEENWIVAKYVYKRPLEGKIDYAAMAPEIRVIVFPDEATKASAKRFERKGDDGSVDRLTVIKNPYRNYLDYLERNYDQGGWHVAEEESTKSQGLEVTKRVIKVEKLARNGERTITAWEFKMPGAAYVVQTEILADWDHKFEREFSKMLHGFRDIPRDSQSLTGPITGGTRVWDWDPDLTPQERKKVRSEAQERIMARAIERLTEGWNQKRTKEFLFLWNCKSKFANNVMKQAEAVRKFLDDRFEKIGDDYVIHSIIRVAKNLEEANSYADSSGDAFSANTREVVIHEDNDWGFKGPICNRLNQGIARAYFHDKNSKLWYSLPPWLDFGMSLYIGSLVLKRNKLEFEADDWDMEVIRDRLRNNSFRPAKELLTAREDGFGKTDDRVQSAAICAFLMDKAGRNPKYSSIINDYLLVLDAKIKEIEKAEKASKSKDDDSGGDDEEDPDAWKSEWKGKRQEIIDHCFEKIFGGWSDADWQRFDEEWREALR